VTVTINQHNKNGVSVSDISTSGSFDKTEIWLKRLAKGDMFRNLEMYGKRGCEALANATPVDSGLTADSWEYKVFRKRGRYTIVWYNTHATEEGTPVAILIQYGHGTGTGGWIEGKDFINPVIQPLFDNIADAVWKEVTRA